MSKTHIETSDYVKILGVLLYRELILETSGYLQKVRITQGDFEEACKEAGEGDFVFIDSPYAPLNPTSFE